MGCEGECLIVQSTRYRGIPSDIFLNTWLSYVNVCSKLTKVDKTWMKSHTHISYNVLSNSSTHLQIDKCKDKVYLCISQRRYLLCYKYTSYNVDYFDNFYKAFLKVLNTLISTGKGT